MPYRRLRGDGWTRAPDRRPAPQEVILSLETTAATSGARRFYFHLEFKGHVLRDRRSEEFASRIAARERGFAIARAIAGRRGTGPLDPEVCVLKDDRGRRLGP